MGIKMLAEYENFEALVKSDPKKRRLSESQKYKICTDQQRLQQILLNLISNSFKFTPKDGYIKIKAKYIQKASDLSHQDHQNFIDIIN